MWLHHTGTLAIFTISMSFTLSYTLEGIWGRGRAVSGPFPYAVPDAA